jgi:hypothetical protein
MCRRRLLRHRFRAAVVAGTRAAVDEVATGGMIVAGMDGAVTGAGRVVRGANSLGCGEGTRRQPAAGDDLRSKLEREL